MVRGTRRRHWKPTHRSMSTATTRTLLSLLRKIGYSSCCHGPQQNNTNIISSDASSSPLITMTATSSESCGVLVAKTSRQRAKPLSQLQRIRRRRGHLSLIQLSDSTIFSKAPDEIFKTRRKPDLHGLFLIRN